MTTLLDLVRELRALGIGLDEIKIPYSWYQQILAYAQELLDKDQDGDEDV